MTDYSMTRKTYRYFTGEPLYPFGYGLSYSTFVFSKLYFLPKINAGDPNVVQVRVFNEGPFDGDEVRGHTKVKEGSKFLRMKTHVLVYHLL